MEITASIVTYNNCNDISKVLPSLIEAGLEQDNIYVVDNNSKDNTISIVKKFFPKVNVLESKTNLGYGGGHNIAINLVNSDYHIIVNPDIILDSENLRKMIDFVKSNPDIVILTPKVLNPDLTTQFLPKRRPTFKYCVASRLPFKFAKKIRKHYTMEDVDIESPVNIDFCTGCFMFCKTSALKHVGGFDERYFMYFEDADLTLKMKEIGRTTYYPNSFVIHQWKRESKTNKRLFYIHIKSMFKFLKKWKKQNDKR